MIAVLTIFLVGFMAFVAATMPAPFTRELKLTTPYMTGNDVIIAQNLLNRDSAVKSKLTANGIYDQASADATSYFQASKSFKATGILDDKTAQSLLDDHTNDNYKDNGFTAGSKGYLYKFHIPVHNNRSIETYATLFDKDNNELLKFRVRTHGKRNDGTSAPWPDFGTGDVGYTQFGSSGNTVTGLVEIDLNSPEPDPDVYGPWPVNRIVRGLDGNAAFSKFFWR